MEELAERSELSQHYQILQKEAKGGGYFQKKFCQFVIFQVITNFSHCCEKYFGFEFSTNQKKFSNVQKIPCDLTSFF